MNNHSRVPKAHDPDAFRLRQNPYPKAPSECQNCNDGELKYKTCFDLAEGCSFQWKEKWECMTCSAVGYIKGIDGRPSRWKRYGEAFE